MGSDSSTTRKHSSIKGGDFPGAKKVKRSGTKGGPRNGGKNREKAKARKPDRIGTSMEGGEGGKVSHYVGEAQPNP